MSTSVLPTPGPGTSAKPAKDNACSHSVQFYREDDFLLDKLRVSLGGALAEGSSVLVIATKEHRDALALRLAAAGVDLGAAATEGRYISLDAAASLVQFMVNGSPDPARFTTLIGGAIAGATVAAGPHGLVAFGEMVALLWEQGNPEAAIGLEKLWNRLGQRYSFSLLCAYPMKQFCRDEHLEPFSRICTEHSRVIPDESYTGLDTAERLRDISRLQLKAQLLEGEKAARREAQQSLQLLEAANQNLREFSAQLLRLQDDERRRIAYDLHETTGQDLALLGMNLSAMESEAGKLSPQLAGELSQTCEIAGRLAKELRAISYLLYPPLLQEMGLEPALRWYIEGFTARTGIAVKLEFLPCPERLSSQVEITLFRVVQECLANVQQQSGSTTALVSLCIASEHVILEVRNERVLDARTGKAGTLPRGSESNMARATGLQCIRERVEDLGGMLRITSRPGGGHLEVVVPHGRGKHASPLPHDSP